MAFFDTLGKTLSEKGKEAAKKAKDLTETMQLKAQISGEENNLKQAYQEAGRLAFESGLTAQADEYETIFSRIKESKTRILLLPELWPRMRDRSVLLQVSGSDPPAERSWFWIL